MAIHFQQTVTQANKCWQKLATSVVFAGAMLAVTASVSANGAHTSLTEGDVSTSASQQEQASALPALVPFEAYYDAFKWNDKLGDVHIKLESLSDQQYSLTYSSELSKFFLSDKRFEHSIFTVVNGEIIPASYHYSRSGTGPDKKKDITFSDTQPATMLIDSKQEVEWHGELDNQLYRIDFPRHLAKGVITKKYDFVNSRGQLRSYTLEAQGEQKLSLPIGELDTIKVKIMRDSTKRETIIWFAPSLNYTLVRLQQFKDGDEQGDIQLRSYTLLNE